jgi:hypothetical protein
VVNVEIPRRIRQIITKSRHFVRSLNTDQKTNAKAICSDGDWLNGESKVCKKEKGSFRIMLDTSGFVNENCKGTAMKNIPAMMVTKSILHVNIFN